ncbi:GNAT family N-acetyltransferase [Candidatus Oscillochloris fontis]|uniref:GNAT family N-acetyltransferase n=1 Tax=Candidatus Oscillochloris fontis TaxID=2496868 RepID=UPI001EE7EB62|nr:GNAT family N-acetyltransferase [Candidatus Oscillochloris fontis]
MHIEPATREDAAAILGLQHRAYQREAELYDSRSIPPLTQTLDALLAEFDDFHILKASIDGQLVGAVRAQISDGICHIGRLMVEPSYQGRGIGQRLMQAIEAALVPAQCYELFTGERSVRNVALYEYLGYRTVRTAKLNAVVTLVYMQKPCRGEASPSIEPAFPNYMAGEASPLRITDSPPPEG